MSSLTDILKFYYLQFIHESYASLFFSRFSHGVSTVGLTYRVEAFYWHIESRPVLNSNDEDIYDALFMQHKKRNLFFRTNQSRTVFWNLIFFPSVFIMESFKHKQGRKKSKNAPNFHSSEPIIQLQHMINLVKPDVHSTLVASKIKLTLYANKY